MIQLIGQLPKSCTVAFSGGVDSVAATDFLLRGRRQVKLAFFHHGTSSSDAGAKFAKEFADKRGLTLITGELGTVRSPDLSLEEFWRNERYRFLTSLDGPVITGHHLDDAVESWIFSSLHGQPKLIPYDRGNVLRPFLMTPKSELRDWCVRRDLQWVEDESNDDVRYMRNLIRHRIVPEALKVNPGLRTVIRKKYASLWVNPPRDIDSL